VPCGTNTLDVVADKWMGHHDGRPYLTYDAGEMSLPPLTLSGEEGKDMIP
jgi:hypothetical protein